jgi:menaquinone-dependent protoporphyrinogen oxidase
MRQVLIAYGTRYGATKSTSEQMAKELESKGMHVTVVDCNKTKIKTIDPYDLIIVGSGMQMGKWTKGPERFLQKFQQKLQHKQVALFVSSAAQAMLEKEGKDAEIQDAWSKYIHAKINTYQLKPISTAILGGVWDFNSMNFIFKRTMQPFRVEIEKAGFKELKPQFYDTRNWDEIKSWINDVAAKVE